MAPLLPRARRTSRAVALGALATSAALSRRPSSGRAEQAVVLAALALGMPHGAADTELLRSVSRGSRRRQSLLAVGYALLAAGSTAVVRRGGGAVERGVLLASAAHFGEGELACWAAAPPGRAPLRASLRLLAAAVTTVGLPAAVGAANQRPPEVGVTGALAPPPGAGGSRSGLSLLRDPAARPTVAPLAALAGVATAALGLSGDREAAGDCALLTALALLAPPSTAFAAYFGGWHALRHTARVADALVADGQLPPQRSLPGAAGELARRSAWAAEVGLAAAGALAAADREHASDNAFAAILGLTVPHMTTVALALSRRGR
jgi:Brp/Blh family beta-carotene 15,15'-monooxygenase